LIHRHVLAKPDGRRLVLYARAPFEAPAQVPSPSSVPVQANPHLRWHPLREEWVAYAAHRQDRTFLPPPEYNPLAVTRDPANPTELPAGDWDVAVFDNRFPSLAPGAHAPPEMTVPTAAGRGRCEVVVYTQDPHSALARLPLDHVELLLRVWADRTRELGSDPQIRYVLPFENRGAEVGVTLHHPHGQLYAYPFVPPVPAAQHRAECAHHARHGTSLLADMIRRELDDGRRILYRGPHAVAFVPPCARYPYEAWVAPRDAVAGFADLSPAQCADLARALKTLLLKYDGLWARPFPYLMAWFQAPLDGALHPESHLHAQFYPPYRTRDKLKVLAGTELAAGMFAVDALPEDKARELQQVDVTLEGGEAEAT
jgi:UDPglucose--hexose-1-phosphate uridylyltransferase